MGLEIYSNTQLLLFALIIIWDLVWTGIALWHSAKKGHLKWFIAMLILSTAGILPIVYLQFFKDRKKSRRKNI